jgi:ElaB/YqjD/DUF883 family membrane-anchored ribosome-binding protein
MAKARGRKNGDTGNGVEKRPTVSGCCNDAIEVASEAVDTVGEWGHESVDGARDAVRARPLTAVAATLTAGAIIGVLMLR